MIPESSSVNVFLDATVLVAVLNKEYPSYPYCARILSAAGSNLFQFYTSPMCLAIAFYFTEKRKGTAKAKSAIQLLGEHLFISEHYSKDVDLALRNKKIHDFEDGLEYYSALSSGCKVIVTGNTNDFYFSEIAVLEPKDFLMKHLV